MTDLDVSDTVSTSVTSVTVTGDDGGLGNAALQAMLSVDAGDVIDNASTTGTINWSFDSTPEAFNHLSDGETLTLEYSVIATDSQGSDSAAQLVTITITGTNDAPVAYDDSTPTTSENAVYAGNVPAATDVDGTIVSYSLDTDVAQGSLTFNADGSYSFAPGAAFDDLAFGESRSVSFTYHATDDFGADSGVQTVTIEVTGANDAPVITVVGTDSASEPLTESDAALSVGGTLTVTDLDVSDTVSTSVTSVTVTGDDNGIANADLLAMLSVDAGNVIDNLSTTGSINWSFDSNPEAFNHLADGEDLTLEYSVIATDSQGSDSAAQLVTITITGTNDAPVAYDDSTPTTSENAVYAGNVPAATDVDGTIVSYSLDTDVAQGSLTFNADGSYSFAPGAAFDDLAFGESRSVSFTYHATDDFGADSGVQTVTIEVTGANDAPVITVVGTDSASEPLTESDAALSVGGTLTVTDLDVSDTVSTSVTSVTVTGDDGGLGNAALQAMLSVDAGDVIDNASTTGTINWSFDSTPEAFNHLSDGETLTLEYSVIATDSQGSDSA
ncbi:MAG: VCBS domain-containing protein, partial [Desulfuromonadales bacterium]|nr:VCBS domain-containing protein [Desulfuromonadales bacterium]